MSDVLNKTADPVDFRTSVNTTDFPTGTWFINPDISAVAAVETKFWKQPLTDPVLEMTQAEKDAVTAAEDTATTSNNRTVAIDIVDAVDGDGVRVRALIELLNKRDNFLTNRVVELQDAMTAMKATSGSADNLRAAIPASFLATTTRDKSAAVSDYKVDITSGAEDTP